MKQEQEKYIVDLFINKDMETLTSLLNKRKKQLDDIIDSYPLAEDRYLCFEEREEIGIINDILKELSDD